MLIHISSENFAREVVTLTGDVAHHLIRVRRARAGDGVRVTDGAGGVADARVTTMTKDSCAVEIFQRTHIPPPRPRITLACALIPRERFRHVLEKSVELGVQRLMPLRTARTVIAAADRDDRKHAHWRAIMESAAAQCEQAWWPTLAPITTLDDVMALCTNNPASPQLVLCWEGFAHHSPEFAQRDSPFTHCDPAALDPTRDIICCIGPEGGFAPEEITALAAAHARALNLGPLALRTETAALAALVRLHITAWEMERT